MPMLKKRNGAAKTGSAFSAMRWRIIIFSASTGRGAPISGRILKRRGQNCRKPAPLRAHLRSYEESGVDQVAFIQQGGRNRHDHICEALELFAREIQPEFREREDERAARKAAEL